MKSKQNAPWKTPRERFKKTCSYLYLDLQLKIDKSINGVEKELLKDHKKESEIVMR